MTRHNSINSKDNDPRIMCGGSSEISPPAHVPLLGADIPYFHSLVEEFAAADWTKHQLELVAILARITASLEEQQRKLFAEGSLIERRDGSLGTNRQSLVVTTFSSQVLALRRSLDLTACA